ncbi:MAG: galactose mutarotase [Ignavibacteriales bacterium]|nr:galactose mutarotase [Ignavibacteriales bacterium]
MNIEKTIWGKTKNSETVYLFSLVNTNGMSVKISNYGGIIQSVLVPDKNGRIEDVVLGYDEMDEYVKHTPYFGSICGRYANRISNSSFEIDGIKYNVTPNEGKNHLHGGSIGFDKVVWEAEEIISDDHCAIKLKYFSKDGEEGYPGNLMTILKYTLNNENELVIEYQAETDKKTHLNLTNHTYFNLTGDCTNTILDHELWINSGNYLPIDTLAIPKGKIDQVSGTPFDFTKLTKIGSRINLDHEQLKNGFGYDHCFIFDNFNGNLKLNAILVDNKSGRIVEMFTTEPAVQLYTGNHLTEKFIGKNNIAYLPRTGVCLETEHYPDSPNNIEFPSTILNPNEIFNSKTVYKFKLNK